MSKIIIFGVGQIAEIAHYYFTRDSEHEIVAFSVDEKYINEDTFFSLPVVALESLNDTYSPDKYKIFIAMSYKKNNHLRADKYKEIKELGYSYVSYISSNVDCNGISVGENCFILENNVLQPFTTIGDNCTLWSGNHIGHHTTIESHCFLASHVVVSGGVNIASYTFIGVNATIGNGVNIGSDNIIGAGSLILKDTDDFAIYSTKATKKALIDSLSFNL